MVIVEKLVEWRLAGEPEVLGENLPQRDFVQHKSHMTRPGFEPGPPRWKHATNRLSYGAACSQINSMESTVAHPLKNLPDFMESGCSFVCSQQPTSGPYPQADESNPYHPILWDQF
jgi:hypothetical protein